MGVRDKKESYLKQTFKRLAKNKVAMGACMVLVILIVLAVLAPVIVPYGYEEMDFMALNVGPCKEHWFGTDALGRDVFSRLIYGSKYSLSLGICASLLSMVTAIIFGSIAGYYGGWKDNVILRICDVLQAIPGLLLAIVMSAVLGPGYINTILAIAVGGVPSTVRMVRSMVMSVRGLEYLEAAVAINCSPARIMFKRILPNILSPIIVGVTMGIGSTIMVASSLSFLGLGIQPPLPEWGAMLSASRDSIRNYPHLVLFPGIFIFVTCLCANLFGDGLRDAMDPKLKD
ncbi:MAG: ABC transporter permease [Lachnospiraceae bacterium]|nr:ABC transporter permease [Lachnospiraceae bacterium]MDE6185848.1 ABC transporter permease [Lachnospiraceae bacterium]MDE7285751.1 ABC transporter permease [Lachnospiraceae bacterium]